MLRHIPPRVVMACCATILALSFGACRGDEVPTESSGSLLEVPFRIAAAPTRVGYAEQRFALRLQPYYVSASGEARVIGPRQDVDLGTATTQSRRVAMSLDVVSCLQQSTGPAATGTCPVYLDVVLVLVSGGLTLDRQRIGPFGVMHTVARALSDTVSVTEVRVPDVLPVSPTIAIGDTVRLRARFVTVRGDTVMRPVEWRSEKPVVATVDSAGLVTGLAAGDAGIVAIFGGGQSSNGQLVVVRRR